MKDNLVKTIRLPYKWFSQSRASLGSTDTDTIYNTNIATCHYWIPYVGLNFAVYESLKDWLVKAKPFGLIEDSELSVTTRLACGAAAGTVGQTVAYPLDVIRRRMQMVGWNNAASVITGDGRSAAPLEYTGMIDAFRKTVRHEGFGALYKGLVPNSVKVVPSIAIAFVTYEVVKDILGVEIRISD
ncbi:mitochondrial adenine nucleotide transporter adnt1 [Quercus suber]|uniref:Mitochondrial adenine nucleotide transporter adnt1 n=1 Tax=Quercus suber TaxID=58331 RepID=A0AAW0KDJ4_QUESU